MRDCGTSGAERGAEEASQIISSSRGAVSRITSRWSVSRRLAVPICLSPLPSRAAKSCRVLVMVQEQTTPSLLVVDRSLVTHQTILEIDEHPAMHKLFYVRRPCDVPHNAALGHKATSALHREDVRDVVPATKHITLSLRRPGRRDVSRAGRPRCSRVLPSPAPGKSRVAGRPDARQFRTRGSQSVRLELSGRIDRTVLVGGGVRVHVMSGRQDLRGGQVTVNLLRLKGFEGAEEEGEWRKFSRQDF